MAKDVYYFKHDANASQDMKCRAIRRKYKWAGMGWFWFIIEQMRNEEGYKLPYSDLTFLSLSDEFSISPEETKKFIDDCASFKLFTIHDGYFCSGRLNRDMAHLDDIRQKTSKAGKISAEKRYGGEPETEPKHEPKKQEPQSKEGETETPQANLSPALAAMAKLYEDRTGKMLTPNDIDLLKDIEQNYAAVDFEKALNEAVNNKVRSTMKYIAKILENWKRDKEPFTRTYSDGMAGMKEAEV